LKKQIEDIIALHDKMGVKKPETTDYSFKLFRMKFILEELMETINACGLHYDSMFNDVRHKINGKENEEEILDGLVDLMVVILGTAHFFGFTNKIDNTTIFELAWDRVQEANMNKIPVKSANESKRGCQYDLLKPEGWKKPEFEDLFQRLKANAEILQKKTEPLKNIKLPF
jgi:predicted HAD superfamily Cof-like phosphohydrolase